MMSQPQQFASVGMARNRKMKKKKESKKKTVFFGMGAKKNSSSGSESDAEMEEVPTESRMMNECADYGAENM